LNSACTHPALRISFVPNKKPSRTSFLSSTERQGFGDAGSQSSPEGCGERTHTYGLGQIPYCTVSIRKQVVTTGGQDPNCSVELNKSFRRFERLQVGTRIKKGNCQ
jgi:hypothetical protein